MADEPIFRFTNLRPAASNQAPATRVPLYPTESSQTPLYHQIANLYLNNRPRSELLTLLANFRGGSPEWTPDPSKLPFDLAPLRKWVDANASKLMSALTPVADLKAAYGGIEPSDLVQKGDFLTSGRRLADTILAESLERTLTGPELDRLALAAKLLDLLERIAGPGLPAEGTLGQFIARMTLVLPKFKRGITQETLPADPTPPPDPNHGKFEQVRQQLIDLRNAHREIARTTIGGNVFLPRPGPSVDPVFGRLDALESAIEKLGTEPTAAAATTTTTDGTQPPPSTPPPEPSGGTSPGQSVDLVFKPEVVGRLSDTTQKVIQQLKLDPQAINPQRAVELIEDEMRLLSTDLASGQANTRLVAFGGAELDVNKFRQSFHEFSGRPVRPAPHHCEWSAGCGDLLLVKQTLKAYEVVDFAHVENVLIGESREREHRRLDLREEVIATTTETETEKERDLQSTEKNELQNEAEKTIKNQLQIDAGVQISGSYGPSLSFSSSLNASYNLSVEESQRSSTRFSREVPDKTAERVRQKVTEERRIRTLQQIEEINKHKIENTTGKHVRGIYRWLNKIYDAQVFRYGTRMMLDFVLPEPAAYFLYATIENPPADLELVRPDPPTYLGQPLTPANLDRHNYVAYLAQYQVTEAPAPPPEFQTVAYFDKQDSTGSHTHFGRAGKVAIPTGYEAYGAAVHCDYTFDPSKPHGYRIQLGTKFLDHSFVAGPEWVYFDPRQFELAISYQTLASSSFSLGIDVFCRLTDSGRAAWQHKMFASIIDGYLRLKSQYDEKKSAQQIQKGLEILGRNPLENRRIERDELKKLIIQLLMQSVAIERRGYYTGGDGEPYLDIPEVCENTAVIRFFENCFEWTNLLYIFYPYFWGRHARWRSALHLTDPDLDFAAFLKAGAARAQLPVRPNCEKAVAYFLQTGEIWEGGDVPVINDEAYVPIIDEITESLGKPQDGEPYPKDSKPWEVRVPTSLVVLQNLNEIPSIRDILTGNPIVITG